MHIPFITAPIPLSQNHIIDPTKEIAQMQKQQERYFTAAIFSFDTIFHPERDLCL